MYDNLSKKIMKLLDLDREISNAEQKYVVDWKERLEMKDEIILEAVRRAKSFKGIKVNFPYINAILSNWYSKDVKNFSDIIALDEKYRSDKENKNESVSVSEPVTSEEVVNSVIREKVLKERYLRNKITIFVTASEYAAKLSDMGFVPGIDAEKFYSAGETALELLFKEDYDTDEPEEWERIIRDTALTTDQKVDKLVEIARVKFLND